MNSLADSIATSIFPKARCAVLGLMHGHPDRPYYLREVVSLTGLGVGHIQRELKRLSDAGIIRRFKQGRHVYFQADQRCPIFEELRGIVTKTVGAANVLMQALEPITNRIAVAFVFGSVARGEEKQASDLDLMVIGDVTFAEVVDVIRDAETSIRREINVNVYPVNEFREKLKAKNHFLNSVLSRDKVFVVGNADELGTLSE